MITWIRPNFDYHALRFGLVSYLRISQAAVKQHHMQLLSNDDFFSSVQIMAEYYFSLFLITQYSFVYM